MAPHLQYSVENKLSDKAGQIGVNLHFDIVR